MCFALLLLVVMFCFCVCLRLVGAILDWFAGLVFCCVIILLFWTVDFRYFVCLVISLLLFDWVVDVGCGICLCNGWFVACGLGWLTYFVVYYLVCLCCMQLVVGL